MKLFFVLLKLKAARVSSLIRNASDFARFPLEEIPVLLVKIYGVVCACSE